MFLEIRHTLPLRKDLVPPLRLPQPVYLDFRHRHHSSAWGVGRGWNGSRLGGDTFHNCSYVL